jgi:hypothetical protein
MLRKNSFVWTDAAKEAFEVLKKAVTQAPVLDLPNFAQSFVMQVEWE